MSLSVDQYLLADMINQDDLEIIVETDIPDSILDYICGWREETQSMERENGLLFPQPIRRIED